MKKVVLIGLALFLTGCAKLEQAGSHIVSSTVKLNRRITLFSAAGHPIKVWEGRMVVENVSSAPRFMYNGKAIIIDGTYVIEEI